MKQFGTLSIAIIVAHSLEHPNLGADIRTRAIWGSSGNLFINFPTSVNTPSSLSAPRVFNSNTAFYIASLVGWSINLNFSKSLTPIRQSWSITNPRFERRISGAVLISKFEYWVSEYSL